MSRSEKSAEARIQAVLDALGKNALVCRGRMFGSEGLQVNGKVFAMLVKGKLVVKPPKARVEALVASGAGAPFDPGHGRLMKEWVAVEEGGADWIALAKEALGFVGGR